MWQGPKTDGSNALTALLGILIGPCIFEQSIQSYNQPDKFFGKPPARLLAETLPPGCTHTILQDTRPETKQAKATRTTAFYFLFYPTGVITCCPAFFFFCSCVGAAEQLQGEVKGTTQDSGSQGQQETAPSLQADSAPGSSTGPDGPPSVSKGGRRGGSKTTACAPKRQMNFWQEEEKAQFLNAYRVSNCSSSSSFISLVLSNCKTMLSLGTWQCDRSTAYGACIAQAGQSFEQERKVCCRCMYFYRSRAYPAVRTHNCKGAIAVTVVVFSDCMVWCTTQIVFFRCMASTGTHWPRRFPPRRRLRSRTTTRTTSSGWSWIRLTCPRLPNPPSPAGGPAGAPPPAQVGPTHNSSPLVLTC